MLLAQIEELRPQVMVFRGFVFISLPTVCPPSLGPALHDAVDDILRIAEQKHLAWFFQRLQAADRGRELHSIVRRVLTSSREFPPLIAIEQHDSIPARAGMW